MKIERKPSGAAVIWPPEFDRPITLAGDIRCRVDDGLFVLVRQMTDDQVAEYYRREVRPRLARSLA